MHPEVRHPRRQPAVSALGLTHEVMTAVPEGDVILLGYVQRDAQVTASDVWPVTVFWRAERKHPAARTRALVLLDADGKEVVRVSGEPLDGYYPFELWREGEIVRDPLQLAMEQYEEYLDPGPYRFGVAVSIEAQAGVNERFVPLGTVEFLGEEKVEDDDEHDDQK